MSFLTDTHLHIYSCHDPAELLEGAVRRLRASAQAPEAPCLLTLTETARDHWFDSLSKGTHRLPEAWEISPTSESCTKRLQVGTLNCSVLAGRQVVTRERLELLALGTTEVIPEGGSLSETRKRIEDLGALPVLAWAPGKWLGKRGRLVETFVQESGDRLWLGDSSLRCSGWPAPSVFDASPRPLLAGSDPLPLSGETREAGGYGLQIDSAFDENAPFASFRTAVSGDARQVTRLGSRNSPFRMGSRLVSHHRNKSASPS